jgi:hypothetical protein
MWVRPIDENDAGFSASGEVFPTPRVGGRNSTGRRMSVDGYVKTFPTPQASDAKRTGTHLAEWERDSPNLPAFVQMFPTPTVNGNNNRKGVSKTSGDGVATRVGGMLNPAFVEFLMGVPIGFTALKDSATLKSRSAPPLRGAYCTKGAMKNE